MPTVLQMNATDQLVHWRNRISEIAQAAEMQRNSVAPHSLRLLAAEMDATMRHQAGSPAPSQQQINASATPRESLAGVVPYVRAVMERHGLQLPPPGEKLHVYDVDRKLAEKNLTLDERMYAKASLHAAGLL